MKYCCILCYILVSISPFICFFSLCHCFISLNYLPNTWQYFIKMFHVLIHAKYQCKGSINVLHMHHLVSCAFHLCVSSFPPAISCWVSALKQHRRWNVSGHFPRLLPDGIERPRKTQSLLSRFWMVYHTTTTSS